ncbi:MAG: TolC family protein [Prosthecochloris sp.]|nr:TolC family protein [Prosthecochloris sp.]
MREKAVHTNVRRAARILLLAGLMTGVHLCPAAGSGATAGEPATAALPPLERILEAALEHSPVLKMQDARIQVGRYRYETEQQRWFEYIRFNSNYGYAVETGETDPTEGYSLGVGIEFSIFDLLSRTNQQRFYKYELRESEYRKEVLAEELQKEIIALYNTVKAKKELLDIYSKARESTRLQEQMAEKEFTEGSIPISELARVTEIASKSAATFQETRYDYHESYTKLELMTGCKLSGLLDQ